MKIRRYKKLCKPDYKVQTRKSKPGDWIIQRTEWEDFVLWISVGSSLLTSFTEQLKDNTMDLLFEGGMKEETGFTIMFKAYKAFIKLEKKRKAKK